MTDYVKACWFIYIVVAILAIIYFKFMDKED